jgi:hypothetical protein
MKKYIAALAILTSATLAKTLQNPEKLDAAKYVTLSSIPPRTLKDTITKINQTFTSKSCLSSSVSVNGYHIGSLDLGVDVMLSGVPKPKFDLEPSRYQYQYSAPAKPKAPFAFASSVGVEFPISETKLFFAFAHKPASEETDDRMDIDGEELDKMDVDEDVVLKHSLYRKSTVSLVPRKNASGAKEFEVVLNWY